MERKRRGNTFARVEWCVCVEEHRKLFPSSRVTPLDMSVMAVRQQEQIDIAYICGLCGAKEEEENRCRVVDFGIYVQSVFLD
jgi:hypothetical protein